MLRRSEESARTRIDPNDVVFRAVRHFPGGAERRTTETYRLGDYFERIELHPDTSPSQLSFRLVFYIREGVDSHWKHVMMSVLRSIVEDLSGVSVTPLA
jgi:hypothetical protein